MMAYLFQEKREGVQILFPAPLKRLITSSSRSRKMIKLTRSQSLGNKGEQWFPAQLPEYWHFQKPTNDLGIDGVVVIAEQNSSNGIEFRVQIKSSKDWIKKGNEMYFVE
jgi:hypothetical protein